MTEPQLQIPLGKDINANEKYCHTGWLLKKGATYAFSANTNDTWNDGYFLAPFNADGRDVPHLAWAKRFLRMPSELWFALLGGINNDKNTYFKIGTVLAEYSPPQDGELVCFANDVPGFYRTNNRGSIYLTIVRIK
ncbi:MAG: hypothetical protein IT236_06210 [Bacteroidia bacterium]|nr:hypothetical protein [Bacteroidia bacterium]